MIPVPSATQIREADAYTIRHEPISSIDLMERAATACFKWLVSQFTAQREFHIYVFNGNNGGDGLAIARMLFLSGYPVYVYEVKSERQSSADFSENKNRLLGVGFSKYRVIENKEELNNHKPDDVIIDALFGTGLSRIISGLEKWVIRHINQTDATVVSVDMPSGLFADKSSLQKNHPVVKAHHTLSFQFLKKAFLMKENRHFTGAIHLLPIGIDEEFVRTLKVRDFIIETEDIKRLIKKRDPFSSKGDYGHAAVFAGSFGKAGAAVLAVKACVSAGAGLTTAFIPRCAYTVMQVAVPEAMCTCPDFQSAENEHYLHLPVDFNPGKYTAIAFGPGMGRHRSTAQLLKKTMMNFKRPVVLDADALNILAENKTWLKFLPAQSILTPHEGEFERLAGKAKNDFHRIELLKSFSSEYQCITVLKGRYTCIATPDGTCYFNASGNASMAKGGSGDVLTGMIAGWLAQGFEPLHAVLIAVHLHGLAGDFAVKELSENAVNASDLIYYSARLLK
jgi:NAD(P)H-hydrate epimerase